AAASNMRGATAPGEAVPRSACQNRAEHFPPHALPASNTVTRASPQASSTRSPQIHSTHAGRLPFAAKLLSQDVSGQSAPSVHPRVISPENQIAASRRRCALIHVPPSIEDSVAARGKPPERFRQAQREASPPDSPERPACLRLLEQPSSGRSGGLSERRVVRPQAGPQPYERAVVYRSPPLSLSQDRDARQSGGLPLAVTPPQPGPRRATERWLTARLKRVLTRRRLHCDPPQLSELSDTRLATKTPQSAALHSAKWHLSLIVHGGCVYVADA
ncbi:MAG: hypothetical protein RI906_2526, partial [Pseudomonadota bacterium]